MIIGLYTAKIIHTLSEEKLLLISLTKTVLTDSFLHPECIRWKNHIVLPWFYIYNLYQNAAAVTNYHKLCGLKTTETPYLTALNAEVQNQCQWAKIKVLAGLRSSWRL